MPDASGFGDYEESGSGVAALWQYKEGGKTSDQFERRLSFLRQQMFDWQADSKDHSECTPGDNPVTTTR